MAYKQMAFLYDELMKEAPYDQWYEFTKKMFKQYGTNIQNIADLGCGTGEITIKLAEAGYQMIGIDQSNEMLTYADQKANQRDQSVLWVQQDLKELSGHSNLDAAISYCDVINYITSPKELSVVFERTADMLKQGGLFIFDVHSLHHVENNMINQTFAEVNDDSSYVWFCSEGKNVGEMHHDMTFFVENGNKYNRFDEYHHQRTFSVEKYTALLSKAGFKEIHVYSDFSTDKNKLTENNHRQFFCAIK